MASRIITKKGSGAPLASDLVHGELAVDTVNKRLYTENAGGTIIELGTAPSTIDINSGTIDGTVIGGSSAAAGTFTSITGTSANINGTVTADGLTVEGTSVMSRFRTGSATDGRIEFAYNTTDIGYISMQSASVFDITARSGVDLSLGAGGTERMRIDSSGNVGIGTTIPSEKLEIFGNAILTTGYKIYGNANTGLTSSYLSLYNAVDGGIDLMANYTTSKITFGTAGSEAMRIDSSGNLLVGTTTAQGASAPVVAKGGVGIIASNGQAITQEVVAAGNGSFTTITVSFDATDTNASAMMEILLTGYSGVYLDYVAGIYANQPDVVMRNNSAGITSVVLSGSGGASWTATITTSVTHPVVKVKATTGRSNGTFNNPPTITFA